MEIIELLAMLNLLSLQMETQVEEKLHTANAAASKTLGITN
jgi:hypothetical protein